MANVQLKVLIFYISTLIFFGRCVICGCFFCLFLKVNIWVPQPEKQLDVIKVTGLAANVERAKQGLLERVKELQAEQEDRVPARVVSVARLQPPRRIL